MKPNVRHLRRVIDARERERCNVYPIIRRRHRGCLSWGDNSNGRGPQVSHIELAGCCVEVNDPRTVSSSEIRLGPVRRGVDLENSRRVTGNVYPVVQMVVEYPPGVAPDSYGRNDLVRL